MTMANPYLRAVKHNDAAKEAQKDKSPVWIGPNTFKYDNVPKKDIDKRGIERNNRSLATLNMLNFKLSHYSAVQVHFFHYFKQFINYSHKVWRFNKRKSLFFYWTNLFFSYGWKRRNLYLCWLCKIKKVVDFTF
jgi:hypothetical protein